MASPFHWKPTRFYGNVDAMKKPAASITCLFLDIGGVLLTDGWDQNSREQAARVFGLDFAALDARHHMVFDTYEEGRLTMDDYLDRVVFNERRPFTRDAFRKFIFERSKPFPEMLDLMARLKARYGLKIAAVSNEARELNAYRIRQFGLAELFDAFISSCYVHVRKPDADIYRLALDITQAPIDQIVYIENTAMFVDIARGLGIRSILHTGYESTRSQLAALGLECADDEMPKRRDTRG